MPTFLTTNLIFSLPPAINMLTVGLVFILFCNQVSASFPSCETYEYNIDNLVSKSEINRPDLLKIVKEHACDTLKTHFEDRVEKSAKRYTGQLKRYEDRPAWVNKQAFRKQIHEIATLRNFAIKDIQGNIEMETGNANSFYDHVLKRQRQKFEKLIKRLCANMLVSMWLTTADMDNRMKKINRAAEQSTQFPEMDIPRFSIPSDIVIDAAEFSESRSSNESAEVKPIDVQTKNKKLVEIIESKFYELVATDVKNFKITVNQRKEGLINLITFMIDENIMEEPEFKKGNEIISKIQRTIFDNMNNTLEKFRNPITNYLKEHPPSEESAATVYTVDYVRGIGKKLMEKVFRDLSLNGARWEISRYLLILNYELTYRWDQKVIEQAAKGWT